MPLHSTYRRAEMDSEVKKNNNNKAQHYLIYLALQYCFLNKNFCFYK